VARDHASPHAVGIIDETGCPKKGDRTPGVQRPYRGARGKVENCVATVHLSYAVDRFHCLLGSDLFLPQAWARDRPRCRQAGIPDEVDYRPKWRMALELLDRALANGVTFAWLTFDEYYGSNAPAGTPVSTLLLVAFSRWHVERCFEDEKTELGFDHYEGRKYKGLIRHQALTAVTHLFLARMREQWGEKSGPDGVPSAHGGRGLGTVLVDGTPSEAGVLGPRCRDDWLPATPECQSPTQPYETHSAETQEVGHSDRDLEPLLMGW
jgi:SRSO17 transposase